jgi:rfaE bifunctional protein nucleotidyltransferase chain/domain
MDIWQLVESKIFTSEKLQKKINGWRLLNNTVVFTNGCFDILHYGHIKYLAEAASLGDKLIIGLNSNSSVKLLKGTDRPIQDQNSRALILSSLFFVDAVVIFEEETPINLIEMFKPDVLVKGGDYTEESIVGAQFVKENGGTVEIVKFEEGYSTTEILNKILNK